MHETADIQVLERGGTRILCEGDVQHIALVRAPTDGQGSEGIKPVFVDQMNAAMDGARRAFVERFEQPEDLSLIMIMMERKGTNCPCLIFLSAQRV